MLKNCAGYVLKLWGPKTFSLENLVQTLARRPLLHLLIDWSSLCLSLMDNQAGAHLQFQRHEVFSFPSKWDTSPPTGLSLNSLVQIYTWIWREAQWEQIVLPGLEPGHLIWSQVCWPFCDCSSICKKIQKYHVPARQVIQTTHLPDRKINILCTCCTRVASKATNMKRVNTL